MSRPTLQLRIYFIEQPQDQVIFRNIGHGIAILLEANLAFFINHHQRRDAPQFEQVHFLSIKIGDDMLGVRQTNEGQVFDFPVTHKRFGAIGADC